MLQGPVGPFFCHLQRVLDEAGFFTKHILFHRADTLFASRKNSFRFSGDLLAWESWLWAELRQERPDAIVLFGSSRPAHQVARRLAQALNVKVIALEEGYLRSGYITCELGGNNHHSPLNQWRLVKQRLPPQEPLDIPSSFAMMCIWGGSFYLWRELTKCKTEQTLYHRKTHGLFKEATAWSTHMLRQALFRIFGQKTVSTLINQHRGGYILVPLQTPSDAQIRIASRGWSNEKLVSACLQAVKESGTNELIVFKTHPLDEKSYKLVSHIWNTAKQFGVTQNIRVLQSGKLSDLAHHSSGMIIINSTSAFSGLHHHVPVLVLGDAIFRHPSIVTLGENQDSISAFLRTRTAKDPQTVTAFINAVKSLALIPGDFYALSSQRTTAFHVMNSIRLFIKKT